MKLKKVLSEENKVLCDSCKEEMKLHPNPGLADANEYICSKCGKKKIVGWNFRR